MKAVVIGGGVTGCVTSAYLVSRGFRVDLYEASPKLGGILKDIIVKNSFYFNDCQYLQEDANWLKDLENEKKSEITKFPHTYGSYTCLDGDEITSTDFAGPVFEYSLTDIDKHRFSNGLLKETSTLKERLSLYPPSISEGLNSWISAHLGIDTNSLNHISSTALHISRIYLRRDEEYVFQLKTMLPSLDYLIGLPRKFFYGNNQNFNALIPANGYNDLFNLFSEYLTNRNVNVHLCSPVKCKIDHRKNISLISKSQMLDYDLAVWTNNPHQLIKELINPNATNLLNPSISLILRHTGNFLNANKLPFYIQVFSYKHPIRRIFIYSKKHNEVIISVETLNLQCETIQLISDTYHILKKFFFINDLEFITSQKQTRKILITNQDMRFIEMLQEKLKESRIIDGGWHLYGREARINYVQSRVHTYITAY